MRYSPNHSLSHLEPGGSALKLSLQSKVLRIGDFRLLKFNLIMMRVPGRPLVRSIMMMALPGFLFLLAKKKVVSRVRDEDQPRPKEQGAVKGAKFVENHRHLFGCFGNNFRKESIFTNFQ